MWQMILAVLLDGDGRPVCSEIWPGNTTDVTTLIPVLDRLRQRFAIARVCGRRPRHDQCRDHGRIGGAAATV